MLSPYHKFNSKRAAAWQPAEGELCFPVTRRRLSFKLRRQAAVQPKAPPGGPIVAARVTPQVTPAFVAHFLTAQASAPAFWLGILSGTLIRAATRLPVELTFGYSQNISAPLMGYIACAGLSAAVGMAVHVACLFYRYLRPVAGHSSSYSQQAFILSAVTSLVGGILGGCLADAIALIATAGTLVVGMAVGAALGIPYAILTTDKPPRVRWSLGDRIKIALQGAAFGIAGGICGAVCADLFSGHSIIVATIDAARNSMLAYFAPASPTPTPATIYLSQDEQVVYEQAVKVAAHALPR